MSASTKLLAMGNPLLDMQISTDEKMLEKYGLKANDAVLVNDSQKGIYAEVASLSPVYVAGGAAQNAARCAQYILPENSTVYLGAVGDDDLANQLREANKKAGLKELYQVVKEFPTGACACLITGHHRSLCTQLGAAEKFSPSHLKTEPVVKAIQDAQIYYLGGFFLTHGIESSLALAQAATESQKIFTMNLSAPFIAEFFKDNVDQLLPHVDYLFGNESEAAAYAAAHNWDTKDLPTIAVRIAALPKKVQTRPRVVIITQGSESTIVASTNASAFSSPADLKAVEAGHVLIVPVSPLKDEEIVDTNGAGDAFAGGVLAGLVLGKPIDQCIEIGHKLGKMCVGQVGPQLKWPKVQVV
ncbi:adenosine kinase [Puccinia graminis f. sp. tritici]|uniref:Adenosine kinase n=1 Tax=Puccinia graminis f. sp. tritici TaxID=56615 RepID=A0A5B0QBK3_PUCGR|nr:adenosine kinase [Puccinia graminis f. sp. tritici]